MPPPCKKSWEIPLGPDSKLTLSKLALKRVIPSNTTSLEVLPSSVGPWGGDLASGSTSSAPSEG